MKKLIKKMGLILFSICFVVALTGCGQSSSNNKSNNESNNESNNNVETSKDNGTEVVAIDTVPVATIVVKDFGTITLELEPEMAPNTVNNFITLANSGFYDGLIFHRVIQDFMIQGGDPDGIGTGGPGYSIAGEFESNGYAQNTLSHSKGVISMARSQAPDSAGSQFFIMSADGTDLDGQYAAFGKVTNGIEVVEAIEKVATDNNDKPVDDVVIESIRVETNGVEVPAVVKITE